MEHEAEARRTRKHGKRAFGVILMTLIVILMLFAFFKLLKSEIRKCREDYQQFIIESEMITVSGDAFADEQCTVRVSVNVKKTQKFGTISTVINDEGIEFQVARVIWKLDDGTYQDWYFRVP